MYKHSFKNACGGKKIFVLQPNRINLHLCNVLKASAENVLKLSEENLQGSVRKS